MRITEPPSILFHIPIFGLIEAIRPVRFGTEGVWLRCVDLLIEDREMMGRSLPVQIFASAPVGIVIDTPWRLSGAED